MANFKPGKTYGGRLTRAMKGKALRPEPEPYERQPVSRAAHEAVKRALEKAKDGGDA
jgi:hypothetical protein